MKRYGATVYVQFNVTKDQRLRNMMDSQHQDYRRIPKELYVAVQELKEAYEWMIPLDFRYFYALREFEVMGVLTHYEDALDVVLSMRKQFEKMGYDVMVTAGFGEIRVPSNHENMQPLDVLNRITGDGVHSAFQYFKKKKRHVLKEYRYYFSSYQHRMTHFNVREPLLRKRFLDLKNELKQFQKKQENDD